MQRTPMTQTVDLVFGDALIIVDMQNDFLPGGSLAVVGSDRIIPVINAYIAKFRMQDRPIITTRDWHPSDHDSFVKQGGPWPAHCIAGSNGAEFSSALRLPETATIVSTGIDKTAEGYSAFAETSLHTYLERAGIKRLFVCGVATDYCVLQTVLDALRLHYRVFLLQDAIKPVNVDPDDGENAINTMLANGAELINLDRIS